MTFNNLHNNINNDNFSWSYSRENIFKICPRAYFYKYYGAINGWDKYANDETKHIYLLKNIKKAHWWIKELIVSSIKEIIIQRRNNYNIDITYLNQIIIKKFHKSIHSVINEDWKSDAKYLNLFEIYYSKNDSLNILDNIKDSLLKTIAVLIENQKIQPLLDIPYIKFINSDKPTQFYINDLKIWCKVDFIWKDKNNIHLLNFSWKENKNPLQIASEMIKQNYPNRYDNIILQNISLLNGNTTNYETSCEVRNFVIESASTMLNDTRNFPKINDNQKCEQCIFKEMCLFR